MIRDRVGEMTVGELEALIDRMIVKRLRQYPYIQRSDRPVGEILKAMRRNVWTPPLGAKSSLELLREDRDR